MPRSCPPPAAKHRDGPIDAGLPYRYARRCCQSTAKLCASSHFVLCVCGVRHTLPVTGARYLNRRNNFKEEFRGCLLRPFTATVGRPVTKDKVMPVSRGAHATFLTPAP